MTDERRTTVPVWTLATGEASVPMPATGEAVTAERLAEWRGALAAMVEEPVLTLEVHPLPEKIDRRRGLPLDAASPLARQLTEFVTRSASTSLTTAKATASGGNLFTLVVPAKHARAFGQGLLRALPAKDGGQYSTLVDSTGKFVAHARYVPVQGAAAAGAAGGAGATAGAVAAGGTALTVAAPLVLMAVAAGMAAHADRQRQLAIEHITDLLEQMRQDKLDDELSALNGCRAAVDKATAILLDQGDLGQSLGLDSSVSIIEIALSKAGLRLERWLKALDGLPPGEPVELAELTKAFPGVEKDGGVFHTHVALASLALSLARRVAVLQAVEHAQKNPGNPFENFLRALAADRQRFDDLESGIARVLVRLSHLELSRPGGIRPMFTQNEVDALLRASHRLHRLGRGVTLDPRPADVAIDIVREPDGSVIAFPAQPA
ncbi:hypothetical protein MTQ10_06240 [Streptomyces sp. XM83C]|uniref:hypothetical protein n=1 Tax=Streptomyces sp. XM83C TaxID=2929781 RepID=UPI001FF96DBC|nr:hypothetical protein [Streptomyces sp. XM83C]MCK1819217.1 hypothetical protein [Streptomyces sp. XM83C]